MTEPETEHWLCVLKGATITATLAAATERLALQLPASSLAERLQVIAIAAHEKALATLEEIEQLKTG